ncbi:glycosyltransferase [Gordonia insulae]|uniref:Putative glycosyltransferase n=1 Tax=Gordonia insulae TaxID=2420509 RepID=A0A3G8JJG0_9ACTN|nr:nucleotide disphospho-sugar-binding domain-containing protein [Gordonia insulae]AZG45231.1 putative glycosyltransferase [Gordonia insulae]
MTVNRPDEAAAGRHIAIVLYGSRGDIQPGICLALELQHRGHRVSVLAPPELVDLARSAGVGQVRPVGLDAHQAWSSDAAVAAQRHRNPLVRLRFTLSTVRAGFAAFDDALIAEFLADRAPLADVDLLVVAPLCQERGLAVAERLDVGLVVLRYGPMSENGVVGSIPGLTAHWSVAWKRRSWRIADRLTWVATGWHANAFRRSIGVPRARGPLSRRLGALGVPQLQAYDAELFPGLADDWGETKPITGFFDLPPENRAKLGEMTTDSTDLANWLVEGEPPLFVTFGSMSPAARDRGVAVFREVARGLGLRCLIAGETTHGVDPDDDGVFAVGAVDHATVLPRCAAAVHHGGAGTTAASLRAGLPTLVCSVTADQPFWGQSVRALRVGDTTRLPNLTPASATAGLEAVLAAPVRAAAQQLAARMVQPEKAVAVAADIVEARARPR